MSFGWQTHKTLKSSYTVEAAVAHLATWDAAGSAVA